MVTIPTLLILATLLAGELLDRSIHYHDPEGLFWKRAVHLVLRETRPDGPTRKTRVTMDNAHGQFEIERRVDGRRVTISTEADRVETLLDGSADFSAEDTNRYRLSRESALRSRNYYLYLYGLPMKLHDPGAHLAPDSKTKEFMGVPAYELRVTYDEDVGGDTWYFYLDRQSYALIGYRFYHDESRNDGEYIVLDGESVAAGLRIPKIRKWYRHEDDRFLGTDTIESIRLAPPP